MKNKINVEKVNKMLNEYYQTKNKDLLNQIIKETTYYIYYCFEKMNLKEVDDDLLSYAYEGLYKAIINYNPSKHYFGSLAVLSIHRSIYKRYNFCKSSNYRICKIIQEIEIKNNTTIYETPKIIDEILEVLLEEKIILNKNYESFKRKLLFIHKDNIENYLNEDSLVINDVSNLLDINMEYVNHRLDEILKCLGERNEEIVRLYFGINVPKKISSLEIANNYFLTKSSVHDIIRKSLRYLKNSKYSLELKELLGILIETSYEKSKKI